jgi:hypothetical protein
VEYVEINETGGWGYYTQFDEKMEYMKKDDYKTVLVARGPHAILVDKFSLDGVLIRDPYQGMAAKLPFVEFMRVRWMPVMKFLK